MQSRIRKFVVQIPNFKESKRNKNYVIKNDLEQQIEKI